MFLYIFLSRPQEDEDGSCLGVISRTLLQRTELAALRARGSNDLLGEKEALIMLADIMDASLGFKRPSKASQRPLKGLEKRL